MITITETEHDDYRYTFLDFAVNSQEKEIDLHQDLQLLNAILKKTLCP